MTVVGNDISISIDGIDYTNKIVGYTESGGEKKVNHIKCMGNNYKTIVTGRTDYALNLKFKNDSLDIDALFEDDTGVDIDIDDGTDTITYTNMVPKNYTYELSPEGVSFVSIVYSASAYDATGNLNKEVL